MTGRRNATRSRAGGQTGVPAFGIPIKTITEASGRLATRARRDNRARARSSARDTSGHLLRQ
ncbi:MAG TPA: hypothetical protein VGI64_07965 [Streptosporangiaceae bacterium]